MDLVKTNVRQGRRFSGGLFLRPGIDDPSLYPGINISLAEDQLLPDPGVRETFFEQLEHRSPGAYLEILHHVLNSPERRRHGLFITQRV